MKALTLLVLFPSLVLSADEFAFNTDFIYGQYDKASLEKALYEGKNESVVYQVDINGEHVGNFHFTRENQQLIFQEELLGALSRFIKPDLFHTLSSTQALSLGSERYSVQENAVASVLSLWFKDADVKRDLHQSTLPLSEPINSFVTSYSLVANYYSGERYDNSDIAFPFTSNIKLGIQDWGVNLDLSSSDLSQDGLSFDNLYFTHLLEEIKSEATLGQAYAQSLYDEGFSFGGVQLNTVASLFSDNDRNYTPSITGYAKTNAVVEVYQGKRLLYTKAVAAGEFTINEVKGASNQLMRVVVNESDGTTNTFFYENTVISGLLTPGAYTYQANLGRYRHSDNEYGDAFASFEYAYGFERFTPTTGAILSEDYMSGTLGIALPLQQFGALSVSYSSSQFDHNGETLDGNSYSVNYSKHVDNVLNVQVAGFRYSDEEYMSFNDAQALKSGSDELYHSVKNRYSVMLNGKDPMMGNNISLSFMLDKYWEQQDDQKSYVLNYGGNLYGVNYNLSMSRSYSSDYGADSSVSLNFDIPIGTQGKSAYARVMTDGVGSTNEIGVNSYSDDSSWNLAVSGDKRVSGSYYQRTDAANIQTNFTKGEDYWNGSGSVSGTVVVADGQVMASNNQSTTFAVVDMGDVASARINGVETQNNGRALVPLNQDFSEETLHVDMASIPNGVSVNTPSVTVRPQRDRVMKVSLNTERTLYLRATLLGLDAKALTFGSSVKTSDGRRQHVGVHGDVLLPISLDSSESFDTLVLSSPDSECTWRMDGQDSKARKSGDLIDFGALVCKPSLTAH